MGFGALLAVTRGVPCVARAFLCKLALLRSEGSYAAAPRRRPVSAAVLTASTESSRARLPRAFGAWRRCSSVLRASIANWEPAADIITEPAPDKENIASVGLERVRTTPQTTPE